MKNKERKEKKTYYVPKILCIRLGPVSLRTIDREKKKPKNKRGKEIKKETDKSRNRERNQDINPS